MRMMRLTTGRGSGSSSSADPMSGEPSATDSCCAKLAPGSSWLASAAAAEASAAGACTAAVSRGTPGLLPLLLPLLMRPPAGEETPLLFLGGTSVRSPRLVPAEPAWLLEGVLLLWAVEEAAGWRARLIGWGKADVEVLDEDVPEAATTAVRALLSLFSMSMRSCCWCRRPATGPGWAWVFGEGCRAEVDMRLLGGEVAGRFDPLPPSLLLTCEAEPEACMRCSS